MAPRKPVFPNERQNWDVFQLGQRLRDDPLAREVFAANHEAFRGDNSKCAADLDIARATFGPD